MKIDMISEHAGPLAALAGPDAGGQNVHVGGLAAALGRRGHEVTVLTRRDNVELPDTIVFAPGVTVEHVTAGPMRHIPKDRPMPYLDDFAVALSRRWRISRPDIVHAHFWMSGIAALKGMREEPIPLVQSFHALGSVKQRHQKAADTSPVARIRLEGQIARSADAIVATCTDEVSELAIYGTPLGRIHVVPCGVDTELFRPNGPASPCPGDTFQIIAFGRLVPRRGVDTVIAALPGVPDAELVVAGGPDRDRLRLAPRSGV
jgi:glycosyltransferase involved in cell wall biosynthesis